MPLGRKIVPSYICLIAPALAVYLALIIIPTLFSLVSGFAGPGNSGPAFAGFDNYRILFLSPGFWAALRNNVLLAAVSVFVQIPLGFIIAYILFRRFRRSASFFRALLLFPAVAAPVMTGALFRFLAPGFVSLHPLLASMAVSAWMHTGIFTTVFLLNLQRIDESILEAARMDGAGEWQILFKILLPAFKRVIGICALLAVLFSFRAFDFVYILTRPGQGAPGGQLLSSYMYTAAFGTSPNYFLAGAVSSLLAVISLVLFIIIWSGGMKAGNKA
jgi:raffinose/stachyose/melibiose transport system permease protein